MRTALRWLGRLGMLLSLGFLLRALLKHVHEFPPLVLSASALGHLALAAVAALANLGAGILNWKVLLGGSRKVSLFRLSIVFGYAQVAKYLPGNVFQYVFGVVIGRQVGIPAAQMVAILSAEMLVAIATAFVFGGLGLASGGGQSIIERSLLHVSRALHSPLLLLAGTFVLVLLLLAARRWPRPFLKVLTTLRAVPPSALVMAAVFVIAQCVLAGACIREMALVWAPQVAQQLPSLLVLSSGFAVAWVVGTVVPGAPGGVGIREAILVTLFAPALGQALALATFLAARALGVVCELLVFAPAPFALRRLQREEGALTPAA